MTNTTSGTYTWQPALVDVIITAYGRCQIRRTNLNVDHLHDAAMACNLLQVEWSNEQINLWTVELMTTSLLPGVATYDVDPATVMNGDPGGATGGIEQGVEQRPVRDGIRAVAHGFGLAIGARNGA